MFTGTDVGHHIKEIIAEKMGIGIDQVTPEANFVKDLKMDSLDQTDLVMALEEAFEVSILDEQAVKIMTVQDAINLVKELKG